MVGGIVCHNICICGFSVNVQFIVIVIAADRQVEVLQCIIFFFRYFEFYMVIDMIAKVENFVSICSALIIND
jgi:hypothetical protein